MFNLEKKYQSILTSLSATYTITHKKKPRIKDGKPELDKDENLKWEECIHVEVFDTRTGKCFYSLETAPRDEQEVVMEALLEAEKQGRPLLASEAAALRSGEIVAENERLKAELAALKGDSKPTKRRGRKAEDPEDPDASGED